MALLSLLVPGDATRTGLWWGAASGAVMALAIWCFYEALATGPISFVSPATAVLVAGLPVVAGLIQGERPSALAWLGILVGVVAVLLVSRTAGPEEGVGVTRRTLLLTVVAGATFALSFILTAQIPEGSGLVPLFVARVAATVLVFAVLVPTVIRAPGREASPALVLPITIGIVDVVANAAMYYTFQYGELAVGSVVIALYPAFTVAMAIVLLRERVSPLQGVGLLGATASVLLVSFAAS